MRLGLCMESVPPIEEDEILLRRVPPSTPTMRLVELRSDGTERVASVVMTPRKDRLTGACEEALSCSRLRLISPMQLLENLRDGNPPIDPTGWRVCYFRVADIRRIGDGPQGFLDVRADPRTSPPIDLGHCGIYGSNGQPCPKGKSTVRRMAEVTQLFSEDQVSRIQAGGKIS